MSDFPPEKAINRQQHPLGAQEGQGYGYATPPPPLPMGSGGGGGYGFQTPGLTAGGSVQTGEYYSSPGKTPPVGGAGVGMAVGVGQAGYPGARPGSPTEFLDPTQPRPNDILPLHPAIIQQRQIAATLPPCPRGGYHELRSRYALGVNAGTLLSVICFPVVCCCVRNETVCIKCDERFNFNLPPIQ